MYEVTAQVGLGYARAGDQSLLADLYLPATEAPPPAVIWVHGGGWTVGSRTEDADTRLRAVAAHGLAVLSVDYRLADVATFPAQLHDVKAAVRWLRAEGAERGVDPTRIGIWGASAGGHLAAMTGLTMGDEELNGKVGDYPSESSAVQAVAAWFGPYDLLASASRSWLEEILRPEAPAAALLGVESPAAVSSVADLARQASPVTWVSADAPPFLLAHGDRDWIVPLASSQQLHDALVRVGAESSLVVIGGAGHEDRRFDAPANIALTAGFFLAALRNG